MPDRYAPHAFAFLRIVAGLLFASHGAQKLLHWPPGGPPGPLPPLLTAAAVIELVGGLLVALGLLTHAAAFVMSGEMAVAYFMVHAKAHWHPVVNKGEPAVLYCFLFLFIAAHGAGIWSLDALRGGGRAAARA